MSACENGSGKVFSVANLRVEYTDRPLGIDVEKPRFSWQMIAPDGERGYRQTAYRIAVADPKGAVIWDTSRVASDASLGIEYGGRPLEAATKYTWTVTVWDQNNTPASNSSWFETGLMNPDPSLSAWEGATWIGGGDEDLVLYSHYLSVFKVQYTLKLDSGSTRAGFILGANDGRLMDRNKNIYNIESGRNESYIKFELDISNVDGSETGLARLNVYRAGYKHGDSADKPLYAIEIPLALINSANMYGAHDIYLWCVYGLFTIFIDGTDDAHRITRPKNPNPMPGYGPHDDGSLNLNPVGRGNDYISFPMAADIGFSVGAGQKAYFTNVRLTHYRAPSNTLFQEDMENYKGIYAKYANDPNSGFSVENGAYVLYGGTGGAFVVADPSRNSMPMLRTEFAAENKKIESARLYVTARGIYEVYINGRRVGRDCFNPGLTQYNITHMYQTYDVTGLIRQGESNAVGAWLGEGWWSGAITFSGSNWNYFGDRQSLLAKLVITYADGGRKVVTTSPADWKYFNNGPVVYGSFFQGEVYDASKEAAIKGWDKAGYDDSGWKSAVEVPVNGKTACVGSFKDFMGETYSLNYDKMALTGQIGQNAGAVSVLTAQSMEEVRDGVYVYDMGQNILGIPKITLKGAKAGQKITLRFAEVKYPCLEEYGENAGMIMLENIRAALAQDSYFAKGGDDEVIQPRFTFHGFRYIEITGIDGPLPLDAVQGVAISSISELSSSYETSNLKVNRLWLNIVWSQRDNFMSIPTDCPQRNERMGWSGDISVYSRTSTYIADVDQFLTRHMFAMRDVQKENGRFADIAPLGGGFGGTLWGSAGITVPWEVYQQYGDVGILKQNYDAMKKYIAYLDTRIDPATGLLNEGPLGDWLGPENNKNEPVFLWTVYHIYDLQIMARAAEILGRKQDADAFRAKYEERKAHFNSRFVDASSHKTVRSDGKTLIDTQTSYAVPLALGAFSEENRPFAMQYLADACRRENQDDGGAMRPAYSLMTGFIGTAWISKALSDSGYDDIAYRMLQQTSYPSWLYSVEQGATTIWERLNSYTIENGFGGNNSMNSFNHYSFGAVGSWMYNYSLGIQRDEENPGFKHFILRPAPDPDGVMTYAKGHYDSVYGTIYSEWRQNGGKYTYKLTVPANTTATLYLKTPSETAVTEGGKPAAEAEGVSFVKYENGKAVYELKPGSYEFVA